MSIFWGSVNSRKNPVEPVTLDTINNHERIIYLGKQKEVEKYFTQWMFLFCLPIERFWGGEY